MLVTFSSEAYENIVMFGDVALKLLKLMGHSATIPGAIIANDIHSALLSLENSLAKATSKNPSTVNEQDIEEPQISLKHRALPLINMLKAADKKKCNVMWE